MAAEQTGADNKLQKHSFDTMSLVRNDGYAKTPDCNDC